MNTVRIAMDLPEDLPGALDMAELRLELRVRQLIALELFGEGRISSGKGAELLQPKLSGCLALSPFKRAGVETRPPHTGKMQHVSRKEWKPSGVVGLLIGNSLH